MRPMYLPFVKVMLVGLILSAGIVGSSTAVTNLSISKTGVITAPENITWTITVYNYSSSLVQDVFVAEYIPEGCDVVDNVTTKGIYRNSIWNFTFENSKSEILILNMTCDVHLACNTTQKIENKVNITKPEDVLEENKSATANITLKGRECSPLIVKPETLNIKKVGIQTNGKGGVITVFITVKDAFNRMDILGDSYITCNEANAEKILFSEKDNGTVIAKFRRGDLNLTADRGTTDISCHGEINTSAGKYIIEGSDGVRVIQAGVIDKQASFLDRILRFFYLLPAEGMDETDADADLLDSLDDFRNVGQIKKLIRETPTTSLEGEDEDNEVGPAPNGKGRGRSRGLEIEPVSTPERGNGKEKGHNNRNNEKNGSGED